jgi:peptidoglycan/xylan/chitin deacetylase (PgdA/CDA1 family)
MDKCKKGWSMNGYYIAGSVLTSIVMFFIFTSAYGENVGSIAVNLMYTNGDIADYGPVSLKIYQDFSSSPFKEIESLSGNPFNIVSLPIDHKYKIEAYANSMYSSVVYVDLQQSHQDVTINLPLPGGMRINAFYNDKTTPISNATVFIRSPDNKTWSYSPINNYGQSIRFWIAPTVSSDDYYIVDIKIGENLVYSQSPIYLRPGISQEIKVVTNWPPVINNLITVKVHGVQGSKDRFMVDMFDGNGHKVAESVLTPRGEAYFSNMIVGDYSFTAVNSSSGAKWGSLSATIDGFKSDFEIFESPKTSQYNQSNQQNQSIVSKPISTTVPLKITDCNCVAFRLDTVQDYWLDNVQTKIMDTFYQKGVDLTIGVIGNAFGNDNKLVNQIKIEKEKINIAINGWNFEDFTTLDQHAQEDLLGQAKNKIYSVSGITPSVFIPPYGKANNDTLFAMSATGIKYLSSVSVIVPPSSLKEKVHALPAKIIGGYFINQNTPSEQLLSSIKSAINNDGFAIITLNFQDFAQNNGTEKINMPNMTKIQKLEDLIDNLQNNGIKILGIKDMINEHTATQIPSWIKNNAKWWSDGTISDDDFIKGIQYLVQNEIIKVPRAQSSTSTIHTIPSWIKNNAKWWSDGTISDDDFIKGIQYLIDKGIIKA